MEELEKSNEELKKELSNLQASLNFERSERKRLQQELRSSKDDDSKEIASEEARIREKLKNGKSGLSDDVIDDLMESVGKEQARANVQNTKKTIEREIMELQRNPEYIDVETYGDEIRKMMKNGLSAEQAYWAVAGANKYSNSKAKEQENKEKEDKKQVTKERASEGFVESKPVGDEDKPTYSVKERAIADKLGISAEEAHARSKKSFSIDEILSMNKKFKKGDK